MRRGFESQRRALPQAPPLDAPGPSARTRAHARRAPPAAPRPSPPKTTSKLSSPRRAHGDHHQPHGRRGEQVEHARPQGTPPMPAMATSDESASLRWWYAWRRSRASGSAHRVRRAEEQLLGTTQRHATPRSAADSGTRARRRPLTARRAQRGDRRACRLPHHEQPAARQHRGDGERAGVLEPLALRWRVAPRADLVAGVAQRVAA